jgi:hypothetical protein
VPVPGTDARPDADDVDVTLEPDADGNATVTIPLAGATRLTLDGPA